MQFRLGDYLYPLQVLAHRKRMGEAPWWPAARLEEWSNARRTSIVVHAYHHVPYYRQLLDENRIPPDQADRPEVWRQIPRLTKDLVRLNSGSLTAAGEFSKGAVWASTSGTTGMPLKFLLDCRVNAAAFALFWRAWESGGYWHIGQRSAALKGFSHPRGWHYNRMIRTLELSSGRLDPQAASLYRDLVQRYHPRFLRGWPSSIYLLCRLVRDQDLDVHIPMVMLSSETLHDFQRATIESVLGARVYDHYTHWERAASILECDHGRLHAQEDFAHHEILDVNGDSAPPGTPGELTTTALFNLAMPLIRYSTGDIAAWSSESCACGQTFPVVRHIEGRQNDYLISDVGDLVPSTYLVDGLKAFPELLYFQIIQKDLDSVEVRLVKAPTYRELQDTQRVLHELHLRLGSRMKLDIRFCGMEELERTPVGKIRSAYNRLPREVIERYAPTMS